MENGLENFIEFDKQTNQVDYDILDDSFTRDRRSLSMIQPRQLAMIKNLLENPNS